MFFMLSQNILKTVVVFSYFTQKCFPKDKLKCFFLVILEFFQKMFKSSGVS